MDKLSFDLQKIVETKLKKKIINSQKINMGMNNQLFKLCDIEGNEYLLKKYINDGRDRLWREYNAIKLMRSQGFDNVPKTIFFDDNQYIGLYSFEKGISKTATEVTRLDISIMAKFIADLHSIPWISLDPNFPPAVLSCSSIKDYINNTYLRLNSFTNSSNKLHPIIKIKLGQINFKNLINELLKKALKGLNNKSINTKIPRKRKKLCPIDFGPHNLLIRDDGSACFIDFEYFGVDDPARSLADFVVHDRTFDIDDKLKKQFRNEYFTHTNPDEEFLKHLDIIDKIMEIEWLSIYLQSVTPEKIEIRKFSDHSFNEKEYISNQVVKIEKRLNALTI